MSDKSEPERAVRQAVERSRSGAPAAGRAVRDRFSADEIYQRILVSSAEEVHTGLRQLFFSGLAAGFAITLTLLMHVSLTAENGGDGVLSGILLYPLGFIYIILGNYQLYTENTLPPVILVFERFVSLTVLLRIWLVVLIANVAGAGAGAFVLANTGVLSPEAVGVATSLGMHGVESSWWDLFFKGGFAGLIVAGVVWLDHTARDTASRLILVYLAFLAIPAAGLYHVVVSSAEILFLVFQGQLGLVAGVVEFGLPVLLGNTIGGVVLVTLVNYAQTSDERLDSGIKGDVSRLSLREWVFGGFVGRSDVVSTTFRDYRGRDD